MLRVRALAQARRRLGPAADPERFQQGSKNGEDAGPPRTSAPPTHPPRGDPYFFPPLIVTKLPTFALLSWVDFDLSSMLPACAVAASSAVQSPFHQ